MTEKIAAMRKFFVTDKEQARVRRPAGDPEEMARRFARRGPRIRTGRPGG